MNKLQETTLLEMTQTHDSKQLVYVVYNGTCIFRGVVGALVKFVDSFYMERPAHIYTSALSTCIDVYVQY